MIQGTVTDQSPGQTCLGIPAAGTPAISDDSMSDWMAYLYMQQPKPTDATGVPVTLTAIDPNGTPIDIGTVTSDMNGHFGSMWTPPVPGDYTITATFAGSNTYFGSSTETAIGVSQATGEHSVHNYSSVHSSSSTGTPAPTSAVSPSVAPTPTQPASSAASSMTLYIAAAAAVIIIVAVAAAVVLRRRK